MYTTNSKKENGWTISRRKTSWRVADKELYCSRKTERQFASRKQWCIGIGLTQRRQRAHWHWFECQSVTHHDSNFEIRTLHNWESKSEATPTCIHNISKHKMNRPSDDYEWLITCDRSWRRLRTHKSTWTKHHRITCSTVFAIRISVGQSAKHQPSTDTCCRSVSPNKITESSWQGNMQTNIAQNSARCQAWCQLTRNDAAIAIRRRSAVWSHKNFRNSKTQRILSWELTDVMNQQDINKQTINNNLAQPIRTDRNRTPNATKSDIKILKHSTEK